MLDGSTTVSHYTQGSEVSEERVMLAFLHVGVCAGLAATERWCSEGTHGDEMRSEPTVRHAWANSQPHPLHTYAGLPFPSFPSLAFPSYHSLQLQSIAPLPV